MSLINPKLSLAALLGLFGGSLAARDVRAARRQRALLADKTGSGTSTHHEPRARRKAQRQARRRGRKSK